MQDLMKSVMTPSLGDVHVNRPLTNISVAFMQNQDAFVANRVFPVIPVEKRSDTYFYFPIGEFNRDEMAERAPGAESVGSGYSVSTDQYLTKVYALHKDIADQVRANTDTPLSEDRQATNWLALQGLINRERRWTDKFFKKGVWTLEAAGAGTGTTRDGTFSLTHDTNNKIEFWSKETSTPIEDMRLFKRSVLETTGFMPNTLTVGRPVYDALLDHVDIVGRLDRGQTTGLAMTNRQQLTALFELDNLYVMDAIYNDKQLGAAGSNAFIGGRHALLSYTPPSPGLMTPAAGYTFGWTGMGGMAENGVRMKRMRMEPRESDRIEIQSAYDYKVISADLGLFIENAVASVL